MLECKHWAIDSPSHCFLLDFPGKGLPGYSSGKEPACQCRRHKRHGFDPWVRKILRRRSWQPTPIFLPGESHGAWWAST